MSLRIARSLFSDCLQPRINKDLASMFYLSGNAANHITYIDNSIR